MCGFRSRRPSARRSIRSGGSPPARVPQGSVADCTRRAPRAARAPAAPARCRDSMAMALRAAIPPFRSRVIRRASAIRALPRSRRCRDVKCRHHAGFGAGLVGPRSRQYADDHEGSQGGRGPRHMTQSETRGLPAPASGLMPAGSRPAYRHLPMAGSALRPAAVETRPNVRSEPLSGRA